MQKMIPALTDRQRYWLEHIEACEAFGKSMAEYAASQGIAVRAMYGGTGEQAMANRLAQWCIGGIFR